MNDEPTVGPRPIEFPVPPPPIDPEIRARIVVDRFAKETSLKEPERERLKRLVAEAIGERLGEIEDVRLGRVLGAAIATL